MTKTNKIFFRRPIVVLWAVFLFVAIFLAFFSFSKPLSVAAQSNDPCAGFNGTVKTKCVATYSKCTAGVTNIQELGKCADQATAIATQIRNQCRLKVQRVECERAAQSCDIPRCVTNKSKTFTKVVLAQCNRSTDPQDCHSVLTQACKDKAAGTERKTCYDKEAVEYAVSNAALATSDSVDSTASGISLAADGVTRDRCGDNPGVNVSINVGCTGQGNPIADMAFAFIKFLSFGVGLVIVASIIYAGIQYSTTSGNPENSQKAKMRILNSLIGLVFYLLIFAFVQYLVPGGLFNNGP